MEAYVLEEWAKLRQTSGSPDPEEGDLLSAVQQLFHSSDFGMAFEDERDAKSVFEYFR